MGKYKPRNLDSLGNWWWRVRGYGGVILWGWSRDWSKRNPWSCNKENLPYIGISRRSFQTVKSVFVTLGPVLIGLYWVKEPDND